MKKNSAYESQVTKNDISASMRIAHSSVYDRKGPIRMSDECDVQIRISHYGKEISLNYSNEKPEKVFEMINNAEKGLEHLLCLKSSDFFGRYTWENDRSLIRCLLALEDRLYKCSRKPKVIDGDPGGI